MQSSSLTAGEALVRLEDIQCVVLPPFPLGEQAGGLVKEARTFAGARTNLQAPRRPQPLLFVLKLYRSMNYRIPLIPLNITTCAYCDWQPVF